MDFAERLRIAIAEGNAASEAVSDTGTCCMDFVWIPRKLARPKVAAALGLHEAHNWRTKGWGFSGGKGQAGKRLAFCEAAAKSLHDLGARTIYIMD